MWTDKFGTVDLIFFKPRSVKLIQSIANHVPYDENICNCRTRSCYHGRGTCFIQKIYAPSSSLLQGKHLPFSPSPLRLNIFHLFVILSLTQLYRYTPEIFLFSTATFKYTYRAPLRRIGQEYLAKVACFIFKSLNRIQPLPVRFKLI